MLGSGDPLDSKGQDRTGQDGGSSRSICAPQSHSRLPLELLLTTPGKGWASGAICDTGELASPEAHSPSDKNSRLPGSSCQDARC